MTNDITPSPAHHPARFKHRFIATLKWGGPERELQHTDFGVPTDVLECCASWRRMKETKTFEDTELNRIHGVIASHLDISLVPSNLSRLPSHTTLLTRSERKLRNLRVTEVDFSYGVVPSVCAQVKFELLFSEQIKPGEIGRWQDENDYLDWALSFDFDFIDLRTGEFVRADSGHLGVTIEGPL